MVPELKRTGIIGLKIYQSCVRDYSIDWYDGYVNNACEHLAIDEEGKPLPFLVILSLLAGVVERDMNSGSEMFDRVVKRSGWCMSVVVVRNNEELLIARDALSGGRDFDGKFYSEDRGLYLRGGGR